MPVNAGRSLASAIRPFHGNQPWVFAFTPAFQALATAVAQKLPEGAVEMLSMRWELFPDQTPNIHLDAGRVQGRDVVLFAEIEMSSLMSYFSVVYAIPRYFARTLLVVSPFFPTGTMERVENDGEVATAMTLCRMMGAAPRPSVGGVVYIHFDMHALATRFFYHDEVQPILVTAMPLLLEHIEVEMKPAQNKSGKAVMMVFPDEGAKKRFRSVLGDAWEVAVCSKTRKGDKRELHLLEGEPAGRDVIIVDDMVQSGGTMLECVELLHAAGATSVSCYVTHGVFPLDSWKEFTDEGMKAAGRQPLRAFITTDGIPKTVAKVQNQAPFVVLSLASRIAGLLS